MGQIAKLAAIHPKMAVHVDGARLLHAAIRTGHSPAALVASASTASLCLSKGLGAPMGAVLVGDEEDIQRAARFRKQLGGATRQAGYRKCQPCDYVRTYRECLHALCSSRYIAAAGLAGLRDFEQQLQLDHTRAHVFVDSLRDWRKDSCFPRLSIEYGGTNIVYVSHLGVDQGGVCKRLHALGVLGKPAADGRRIRFVFHRDLTDEDCTFAAEAVKLSL